MQHSTKQKIVAVITSLGIVTGCTSMNSMTGKQETDTGKSVGFGAAIGAAFGGLAGGERGALIGAALGGGLGYYAALQQREKELEEAKQAAVELEKAGFKAKVNQATFESTTVATGTGTAPVQRTQGLKSIEVPLPASALTAKADGLTSKGQSAFEKLDALSKKMNGALIVAVPRSATQGVVADIKSAAPNAQVVTSNSAKTIVATITPQKLEGVRVVAQTENKGGSNV